MGAKGAQESRKKEGEEKEGNEYVLMRLCSFQMDHFHPFKTVKKKKEGGRGGGWTSKAANGVPVIEENSRPSVDRIKAAL